MPDITVSTPIDTFMQSADQAAMRTNLGLGDAATKDTGSTAGTVAAGDAVVLKTGSTMTGKLNLGNVASTAPVNLGANVNPTPVVNGDVWLNTSNQLTWRGNNGATYPAASPVAINSFTAAQVISASTSGAVLGVTQTTGAGAAISVTQNATGTGSGITVDLNNTSSTATAVRITNQGTGASLVVEDQASVDPTPFTVSNSGRVGVGVTPDASVALSVDTTGIKFGDGTIQTTASGGGVAGVSSFSAGTTGLTPSTGTTGAVTLGGTLGVANGGTGATTLTGIVKGNGTSALSAAVAGTDYVAPNGNITGTASNVTGTVAIANGGTGQTTANDALNALLPAQASNNTKLLSTDGTNASWTPAFKFSNTKVVGVDAATIQGCIDLVSSPTALTQVQVLIPPGVYNENLTLKPCVSLASTGLNNGQSSIVRIVGTHTLTGGTSPGDNIIQLNGLRMDYQAGTSPTLTISATGTTPLLVYMQDCMIGNSNASTSSVGVLVNQYCSLRCNNVKSISNSTSGSGGTHVEVNGGTFYGDQFSTEYGTLALRLSGTGGAFKPYAELKQCSLSCTGSNVVDITSTTALFSAGWTGFTNTATTGNGINIAANSVIGVFNSVFVITAGASNYVVTGSAGGVYYSLNNSYSNSTGVPYETKVNANISQFLYSSSIPSAITALTGDVTASGTGSQAASVVRIQGRNVSSTAPTSGQVLAWNGTAWTPTAAGGTGTVTSVAVSGGTTGLTTSGGPVTSSGTITLAGTLGVANGGTGATTLTGIVKGSGTSALSAAVAGTDYVIPSGSITGTASNVTGTVAIANGGTGQTTANSALNALLPSQASNSGKVLSTDGTNTSWITAGGGSGTVTSVDVSGGTTGLTTSGGPVTGSGTITLAGTLTESNGGTGETTYTNGQLLIGNSSGGLTKATLTAGSNVTITNGDGAITIASTGGGGGSTTQVNVYTTSQTITIPAGAKSLYAWACTGGHGGGSGGFGVAQYAGGGGGGAGGNASYATVRVADLTALGATQLNVIVGAGGAGGAAVSSGAGAAGLAGTVSGVTLIGQTITTDIALVAATVPLVSAYGEGGGVGASQPAAAAGGVAVLGQFNLISGTAGGNGATTSSASPGTAQSTVLWGATGGGGGLSWNYATGAGTGSTGGSTGRLYTQGASKILTGATSSAAAPNGITQPYNMQCGGGAGGGWSGNADSINNNGGNGGFPGGGGGGGAGMGSNPASGTSTATRSGKGGDGANGVVVLTWYF